jgi:putative DNA primase/helicase
MTANLPTLIAAAKSLVLARKGRWYASYGVCLCPAHNDQNPSLRISPGRHKLMFHCYAGCDFRQIENLIGADIPTKPVTSAPSAAQESEINRANTRKDWIAKKIWSSAKPLVGSIAYHYLVNRGLTNITSPALRFAANALHPILKTQHPALIALISTADGIMTGIQCSFIDADKRQLIVSEDRRTILGLQRGGAVQLTPCAQQPDQQIRHLGLCEGTENGLAAQQLFGIPVWASLSTKRLPGVAIPDSVTRLRIFADHDAAGLQAARKAQQIYSKPGRLVTIEAPDRYGQDWLDVLNEHHTPPIAQNHV